MIRAADQLGRSVLDRLEAAARRRGVETTQAVEYDWSCPHRFVRAQLNRLEQLAAAAAQKVAEALSARLGGPVSLSAGPVSQHYVGRLRGGSAEPAQLWLELTAAEARPGLVAVPGWTGVGLVQRMLGGSDIVDDPQRKLSPLENELLLDLLKQVGEAFASALRQAGGAALQTGQQIQSGPYRLGDDDAEEFCRFSFNWPAAAQAEKAPASPQAICVVAPSVMLESLPASSTAPDAPASMAKAAGKSPASPRPEELRSLIQAHLERACVVATAWLGTTQVKTRDIISLEAGDVLLMEQGPAEPVQVEVQGRPVFLAQLVRCGSRCAVRVIGPGAVAGRSQDA